MPTEVMAHCGETGNLASWRAPRRYQKIVFLHSIWHSKETDFVLSCEANSGLRYGWGGDGPK